MAIDRARLNELLQPKHSSRITIVRAPAGYGKTTILSQWVSQFQEAVAWLSIDATDNDPIRFWKCLIRTVSATLQNEIEARLITLFESQSPLEQIIDSFLNELGLNQGNIHIVIDDYHLIDNPAIHEMMTRCVDYLPGNVRIYLASRTDLPLPIAKWRVKAWLTELNADQLRFTYEEVEQFYKNKNLMLEDEQLLQYILDMTEGWAAGIQLAGLSIGSATNGRLDMELSDGAHPFITEFLLKEILATLPQSTQDFLIQTSILTPLEPRVCDVLTHRSDSYNVLLELEKKGLFIVRLHSNEPIFRYHHLFADALQIELKHRYSQEMVSTMYMEAAILLREKGDFISAIELVLQNQLYEVADQWMTAHLIEIFTSGQTSTFIRWVRVLRNNRYPVNIETLVMYVITLSNIYEIEEASQLIDELERRQAYDQWMDNSDYQGMASILDTVKAFVLFASGKNIEQPMEIIQKQLKRGRVSSKWDAIPMHYNLVEPTTLRTSIGARGRLWPKEKVLPFLNLFRETEFKEQNMTGFGYGVQAETIYEKNGLDDALMELEQALQYGHRFKDPGLFIPMYILKARIYTAKKQFVEAHALLDYAMETTKEKHWISSLRVMKAYCYLLDGDISQAEQELYQSSGLHNEKAESRQDFWLLVHVRLLLAKGQTEDALKTSIRVKEKAIHESQISTTVEAAILEAVCLMDLSNEEAALSALHKALELGTRYGYIRTFLDEENSMPLLKKYVKIRQNNRHPHWDSVPLAYVEQLIGDNHDPLSTNTGMDILSPREQDVLQLLVSGASNNEIASQLVLTVGTVRIYLSNIYSKIGVNSRTQAVLWVKDKV